jgi:hypothetical protein
VASETFQTWQERPFKGGKTDISNVSSETFQMSQERSFKGGKRDVLKVARPTGRGISSDVLLWERQSWRWKERCLGRGNSDGKRVKDVTISTFV